MGQITFNTASTTGSDFRKVILFDSEKKLWLEG